MPITLISACDLNLAIGNNNKLLVKLPNDMKHFQQQTKNSFCVMGRKTYSSIINELGKPLPNRTSLILSTDTSYVPEHHLNDNVYVYNSINSLLTDYKEHGNIDDNLMVCGGQQTYQQFLPHADYIILTIIDHKFEQADTYFPEFNIDEFDVIDHKKHIKDEDDPYDHSIITYSPKVKPSLKI